MTHLNIPFPSDSPEYRHAYYLLKKNPNGKCTGKHSYKRGPNGNKPPAEPEPEQEQDSEGAEQEPGNLLYENYYYRFYDNDMIYSKSCCKWLILNRRNQPPRFHLKLNNALITIKINIKDNIQKYINNDECKNRRYSQKSQ